MATATPVGVTFLVFYLFPLVYWSGLEGGAFFETTLLTLDSVHLNRQLACASTFFYSIPLKTQFLEVFSCELGEARCNLQGSLRKGLERLELESCFASLLFYF